jgi:hypothetical protein
LTPRHDLTGADRQWAARYEIGDVIRYTRGSRAVGVGTGEYARVIGVHCEQNSLTVERSDGDRVTYDPRRLQGVGVYREAERQFSTGDRVQFTAPYQDERIANRQLGTIERIDASGHLRIQLDSGRDVEFDIQQHRHIDYGYAVTSHSGQGATADRVLVHVDSENAHETLINSRLAYVAVSRGRFDAQIYTNCAGDLGSRLSRDVSKESAVGGGHEREPRINRSEFCRGEQARRDYEPTHSTGHEMGR